MVQGVFSLGWARILTALAALLPLGLLPHAVLAQQGTVRGDIHLLRSRVFHFPVHIDKSMISRTKEVSLYMRDGPAPAPWQRVDTVAPTATSIRCQVPHDGEFSFQIVTVDLLSRPSIADLTRTAPAMTVLVDSKDQPAPALEARPVGYEPQQGGSVGGSPSGGYPVLPQQSTVFPPQEQLPGIPTQTNPSGPSTMTIPPPYTGPASTQAKYPASPVSNYSPVGANRLVNTTRVAIDYNVGRSGASGVARIDIWMTPDGGRSWQRIGEETNHRNPIHADFPGEGTFGIRMVATNGNGFSGKTPVAGDLATVTFEIDLSGPHIHTLEPDAMSKNGVFDIRWKVTDKNLGTEPINLWYSSQRSGPWIPIALKVKNDEVYHWQLPRDVPPQLYFRLEAVDMAGNVSKADTQSPVMLDTTIPEIEPIGIQPVPMPGRGISPPQ